jgi:3D (Asp-Asp-Asp) domain-containing protein
MKKIYPFLILTVVMSFIITYGISEGKFRNYAFAEIFADAAEDPYGKAVDTDEETAGIMAEVMSYKPPLRELKYDIERSGVEHETTIVYNSDQYVGYEKVVQKGSDGMKKSVYQECFTDGELVQRSLEEEIVYEDPVDEIIEVGTKEREVATSRGGLRFSNEMEMVATAYDLSFESTGKNPGDPYYGITASGAKAQPGTVAVDPSVIPLGTKLYIASTDGSPDYGFATALDTGSAIKGYRIDLFMEDNQDAMNFGIKQVKVYILD